jgi:glucokinase
VASDLVLGIDIGGTNTKFGYVDRTGRCLGSGTMATHSEQPAAACFQRLAVAAGSLWASLPGPHRLAGIGLGAPNGNDRKGSIEDPPNLQWGRVDVRQALSPYWDVPIAVSNDANAAALGEGLFGAGQGLRDFIVVTLGTGLGSGLVVNGALVTGSTGYAGELGHSNADPAGRPCGCGLRGCLETYVSAPGLVRTARELAARAEPGPLSRLAPEAWTAKAVSQAALDGDPSAREAFAVTGAILGRKLADVVVLTSPEAIFLFGGLALAGELIFEPTRKALEANLYPVFRGTVQLLPSGIAQGQAGILGAAALMWKELGPLA